MKKISENSRSVTKASGAPRSAFGLYFGIFFLSIVIVFGLSYFGSRLLIETQIMKQLSTLAETKLAHLNIFLEKSKIHAADWASDAFIRKTTEEIRKGSCFGMIQLKECPVALELSVYLKDNKLPLDSTIALVDVLNTDGIVVASTEMNRLGHDEGREHIFFKKAESVAFGEVIFTREVAAEGDELIGAPTLHFISPIVSLKDNKTIGVLLLHMFSDEFNQIFAIKEKGTLEIYFVNREKLMITPSRFVSDAILKQSVDTSPIRECLFRKENFQGSYLNYRGQPVLGTSRCFTDGFGTLVTEMEESEALQSVNLFLNILIFVFLGALFLAIFYILLLRKKFFFLSSFSVSTVFTIFLIIVIVGFFALGLNLFFTAAFNRFIFEQIVEPNLRHVRVHSQIQFTFGDIFENWQEPANQSALRNFTRETVGFSKDVIGVNIFNRAGTVIFSTSEKDIGRLIEPEDVKKALSGELVYKIASVDKAAELNVKELLEIYVPILSLESGDPAVVELYLDQSRVNHIERNLRFWIDGVTFISIVLIFFILHFAFKKQNKEILRQSKIAEEEKSKLDHIAQNMDIGAILLNEQGEVIFINQKAEEFLGFIKDGKIIDVLGALHAKFFKENTEKWIAQCIAGKPSIIPEAESEGRIFEISFSCLRAHHQGDIFGHFIWLRDITEVKLLEKEKSDFVAMASHQLRTPLTVTKGNLEMLIDENFGKLNGEQKTMLTEMSTANERLIRLISDILDIVKIERGETKFVLKPLDLTEVFNSILNDLADYAKEHKIKINYSKPEKTLPLVLADKTRIYQVLQNLIGNAIQYGRVSGFVEISFRVLENALEIKISDNGIGIPKAEQSKIFQRFYRASNAIKFTSGSSGLGLYIAKTIIEQMGGKIWLESEEGKGTTFYFTLPVVK